MRIRTAVMSLALAAACALSAGTSFASDRRAAQASAKPVASGATTDVSSQERRARRPITRLRVYPRYQPPADGVYPRYYPGANAVRDCSATYVQEFRPSGTVITPRVNCFWRPG